MSLVLALAVVEIAARLAKPLLSASVPAYYDRQYLAALTSPDPVFAWVGKPGSQAAIRNPLGETIDYRLNHLGWRDKEFNPIEMPGNALVLGNSFAFGIGVREQDRFSEKLEENFRGLDVWNLGMMGYAPDQYLLQAERWLPPLPWRLAVLQLSRDDVAVVAGHGWKGIHSSTGIPAALEPPFSHSLVSGISEGWNLVAFFGLFGGTPSTESLAEGLKRALFSVREVAHLASLRHIPLIVLQATDWGESGNGNKFAQDYREGVVALAKEENFSLMEAGTQELLPAPDRHWTSAAHRKVADALSPEVYKILFPAQPAAPKRKGARKER